MHATLRRYEGVDRERTDELTEKVTDSLMPRLSELPGFNGYYLILPDRGRRGRHHFDQPLRDLGPG